MRLLYLWFLCNSVSAAAPRPPALYTLFIRCMGTDCGRIIRLAHALNAANMFGGALAARSLRLL